MQNNIFGDMVKRLSFVEKWLRRLESMIMRPTGSSGTFHNEVTVVDTATVNLTLTGQQLQADVIGGSGHVIKDEGGAGLTARANLNFTGAGVTATDNAGTSATDVTIPGSIAVANIGSTAEVLGGAVANGSAATASRSDHKHEITMFKGFTDSAHYTGFPNRTATSLGWNDGAYTLTLTATSDSIWISGVEYVINTLTKALSVAQEAVSGIYWFWITAPLGVPQLNVDIASPGFDKCLVATVYWNTTTNKGILSDERHWFGRDQWMHEYLHETVGVRFAEGLAGSFTDTTFSIGIGEIYDEDIELNFAAPMTTCNVMYHNGDADWKWDASSTSVFKVVGGGDNNLRYNSGNNLATVGNNKYANYWVFASNNLVPIFSVIGTAEFTTIALARASSVPSLGALISAECKLIYKVTYQNNGGTPDYIETTDYRSSSNLPVDNYVATDHGSLAGLADDDHPQYHNDARGDLRYLLLSDMSAAEALDLTDGGETSLHSHASGAGDVATDAIWDAKGDLAVGTGANTAAKLTVGSNGKVLMAASGEATGLKWETVAGTGDVVGPAGATDGNLALFDGVKIGRAHV